MRLGSFLGASWWYKILLAYVYDGHFFFSNFACVCISSFLQWVSGASTFVILPSSSIDFLFWQYHRGFCADTLTFFFPFYVNTGVGCFKESEIYLQFSFFWFSYHFFIFLKMKILLSLIRFVPAACLWPSSAAANRQLHRYSDVSVKYLQSLNSRGWRWGLCGWEWGFESSAFFLSQESFLIRFSVFSGYVPLFFHLLLQISQPTTLLCLPYFPL